MKHAGGQILAIFGVTLSAALAVLFAASPAVAICGDSLRILLHVHGADSTSQVGWSIGALGDVNHDGYGDIAVSQYNPPQTYIFYGGNPASQVPAKTLFGIYQGTIDLDGDGIKDVVTSWVFEQSTAPRGAIYFFKGYPDSIGSKPFDSIYSSVYNAGFGTNVAVGDADGDSLGDLLISQPNRTWGPALYLYKDWEAKEDTAPSWSYVITNGSHQFSSFGFLDYNGDGHQDIFIGMSAHLDTVSYIYIFLGPNYKSSPDMVLTPPTTLGTHDPKQFAALVTNIEDINGDGYADLGVLYDFQLLVYFGGPAAHATYDRVMQGRASALAPAGDVNGDGYNDLIAGQTQTEDGAVDIYLGGPLFDTVYDCSVYRPDLPPLFITNIGYQVSSAGDFNGDGVGDFMFSCRNFAYGTPGDVFVIAGSTSIKTDVAELVRAEVPQSFTLHPAYPNPFNPSTTVSFDLPKRESVKLTVYDVMGRVVRTLMDKPLAAGTHRTQWDGKNEAGKTVASGVYLFRLSTPDFQQTVKGTLLK